jgi:oligopeptide transport system substrate-binding protein
LKNLSLQRDYLLQLNQEKYIKEYFFILGYYSNEYLQKRTFEYLVKLSKTRVKLTQKILKVFDNYQDKYERNIFLKFLAVKFTNEPFQRKVLGILITFNFISKYEKFEHIHLLSILKKIIPGIHILKESFHLFPKNDCLICYCEIEKIRGKNLNFKECFRLKTKLIKEIKDGIELLSPHLFIPKNEEETIKDILRLSREINSIKDFPHVSITFQEQLNDMIIFMVIIVKVTNEKMVTLKKKLADLRIKTEFIAEKIDKFKKNYIKETIVFSLELPNSLFYRKNYAVDLLKARKYICMILEQTIGEFRDFNGALLAKQTEQFDSIKEGLSKHIEDTSDFETIFYSLSPSNIQLLITPEMAIELCDAFYKLKKEPNNDTYNVKSIKSNKIFFIFIKTTSQIYDSIFFDISQNLLIAKTSQTIDQQKYHCLVQITPSDTSLLKNIHKKLNSLTKKPRSLIKQNEIRINFQEGAPPSFHPHLNGDIKTFTVCKALYEGLTRIDPEGNILPAVAEKIEISECKKKYTFILRDTKWSNGEKVTAHDFERAWKRVILSRLDGSNCIRTRNFFLFKNAKLIGKDNFSLDNVGICSISEKQLFVELESPFPYFLHLLANPSFSPMYGNKLNEEPEIFNGPFLSIVHNLGIELTRNEYYWDKKSVKIEKIAISLISDAEKVFKMYKSNQLDWLGTPFNSFANQIQNDKSVQLYDLNSPFWLFCNTQNPKLKSRKIRQALAYAIDREELKNLNLNFQKPLYSIIPENLSYLTPNDYIDKNALEKASKLLEEGIREENLKNFELKLNHSNIEDHLKIAHFLKKSWEKNLSIKVDLVENSWNTHLNSFFSSKFEIGGFNLLIEYNKALYFMNFFESNLSNFSRWENKNYKKKLLESKLLNQAHSYKSAESILMKELPVIPICIKTHGLYMGDLNNFILPKYEYADFKWVSNV